MSRTLIFLGFILLIEPSKQENNVYCDKTCSTAVTNGGYYCAVNDPSKYAVCANGVRYEFSCNSGTVWNSDVSACVLPNQGTRCDCPVTQSTDATTIPSTKPMTPSSTSKPSSSNTTKVTAATTTIKGTTVATKPTAPASAATTTKPTSTSSTTKTTATTPTTKTTATMMARSLGPKLMNRICYITNWAQYRDGDAGFTPEDIDATLCTHIIYAFLNINATSILLREQNDADMIRKVVNLKSNNPGLSVLAAIGGWDAPTATFRSIIANDSSRITFNQGAINFLRQYNFDGLDVNFQFPANAGRGSPPEDKLFFTIWIKSLAAAFTREGSGTSRNRLLLTAGISADKAEVDDGYEVPDLSNALDFMNVMTYDFHDTWEQNTGFNAPLYPNTTQSTVSYAINYLLSKGAPASKLAMGIPFYGRSFKLVDPSDPSIGALAAGPGLAGTYTKQAGLSSYYETCMVSKCLKDDGQGQLTAPYSYSYDFVSKVPYMYSYDNWISTEDVMSISEKVRFAMQKQLGGVMFWSIDYDDFADMCRNGVKYPLLRTANSIIKNEAAPRLDGSVLNDPDICSAIAGK